MTVKNKADLTSQTNTSFADNSSGDISEGDARTVINEVIESVATFKDAGTFEKNQKIAAGSLAYSASITIDLNNSDYHPFTLTGNPAINVPSNAVAGESFTFAFTQDGTGSRQPTWNSAFNFGSGDGSLDGTPDKRQSVFCIYHSSGDIEATVGEEES